MNLQDEFHVNWGKIISGEISEEELITTCTNLEKRSQTQQQLIDEMKEKIQEIELMKLIKWTG